MNNNMGSEFDNRLFDLLAKSSNRTFIFYSNMKKDCARWSKSAVEYFGLEDEILYPADAKWYSRIHPDDLAIYTEDMTNVVKGVMPYHNCEYRIANADGEYVWVNCRGYMTYDEEGNPEYFAGYVTNMGTKNKIDPVTELWTVYEFRSVLERLLEKNATGGILLIGIDNFKRINSEYGYSFGDKVLHSIGKLIMGVLGKDSSVYRMDGAVFSIIIENGDVEKLLDIKKMVEEVMETLVVNGKCLHITFKTAATLFPEDGEFVDQLQNNLFYALENAKFINTHEVVFYSEEIYNQKNRITKLKDALSESVVNDFRGFSVVFQPIIDANTGECTSAEALLRWSNPDFPDVGPMEFIPILEETKGIIPVGKWVIDEALKYASGWISEKGSHKFQSININISYIQFKDITLRDYVVTKLDEYGLQHNSVVLELTESCRIEHTAYLSSVLQGFKDDGVQIALDDFGTGYSSLSVLRDIPADIVKLDHTMIRTITDRPKDKSLIEFIVSYCRKVNIMTCAEGVETANILSIVCDVGAHQIQGYYYDKPLSVKDFYDKYIKKRIES